MSGVQHHIDFYQLVVKSLISFRPNYGFVVDIITIIKEIITIKSVFAEHEDSRRFSNCHFF